MSIMDDLLKHEIWENEKKHKKYLRAYRLGEHFKDLHKNENIKIDADDPKKVAKGFTFIVMLVVSYFLTRNVLGMLFLFVLIDLILIVIGKKVYKTFDSRLKELNVICVRNLDEYSGKQFEKYGICDKREMTDNSDGYDDWNTYTRIDYDDIGNYAIRNNNDIPCYGVVCFNDGVVVGNGYLEAEMRQTMGTVMICQLENKEECVAFQEHKPNMSYCINDRISSLEFNNKYGIVHAEGTREVELMKYFSPSMQLNLIRAKQISKFSSIRIGGRHLNLRTNKTVKLPTSFNIYDKKPLIKYYEEVDVYCREMQKMANEVHKDFEDIDFLRGNKNI